MLLLPWLSGQCTLVPTAARRLRLQLLRTHLCFPTLPPEISAGFPPLQLWKILSLKSCTLPFSRIREKCIIIGNHQMSVYKAPSLCWSRGEGVCVLNLKDVKLFQALLHPTPTEGTTANHGFAPPKLQYMFKHIFMWMYKIYISELLPFFSQHLENPCK